MVNDFNVMQTQAIQFARDMQKKAQKDEAPCKEKQSENFETPFCKNACPIKSILSVGAVDNSDTMLLLALLLVLARDNADRMLMLALLYILT